VFFELPSALAGGLMFHIKGFSRNFEVWLKPFLCNLALLRPAKAGRN